MSLQPPIELYDRDRAERMRKRMEAQGHTPEYIAATVAASMIDSPSNPTSFSNEHGPFSLFDSQAKRVSDPNMLIASLGSTIDELGAQLSYGMHDMQNSERAMRMRLDPQSEAIDQQYFASSDAYNQRTNDREARRYADLSENVFLDFYGREQAPETSGDPLSFGLPPAPTPGPTPINYADVLDFGTAIASPAATQAVIDVASSGTPAGRAVAAAGPRGTQAAAQMIDSTMSQIYQDRLATMDDEKKKIRARYIALALSQGFSAMTLRGKPADYAGLLQARLAEEAALTGEEQQIIQTQRLNEVANQTGLQNVAFLSEMGQRGQSALMELIIKRTVTGTGQSTRAGVTGRDALMRAARAKGREDLLSSIPGAEGELLEDIKNILLRTESAA